MHTNYTNPRVVMTKSAAIFWGHLATFFHTTHSKITRKTLPLTHLFKNPLTNHRIDQTTLKKKTAISARHQALQTPLTATGATSAQPSAGTLLPRPRRVDRATAAAVLRVSSRRWRDKVGHFLRPKSFGQKTPCLEVVSGWFGRVLERVFFRPCLALFPPVAPRAWFRPFPGFQFDLPPRFQIDPAPRLQIKFVSFIVFPVLMFSCGGLSLYFPLCFLPCPPLPFLTFPLRTFPTARVSNQPCARFQIDPAPRLQGKRQPGGDPMNSMT